MTTAQSSDQSKTLTGTDLIRAIEQASIRALPGDYNRYYDGWLLRFGKGYTRRTNSVNPLFATSLSLDATIQHCEALYTDYNQRTIFKMTEAVMPADLDSQLMDRGYVREGETSVQLLSANQIETEKSVASQIVPEMTETWLLDYMHLNQTSSIHMDTVRLMLSRIPGQTGFASLTDTHNTVQAVGLAIRTGNVVGIFDIVVNEDVRRQGYGKQLMLDLLTWTQQQDARRIYLQVTTENEAALALYATLGFEEVYRYWYRARDLRKSPRTLS